MRPSLLPLLLLAACTEFTLHKPTPPAEEPADTDLPVDTPKQELPPDWPEPEESDIPPPPEPEESDVPIESDIPVDTDIDLPPVADAGPDRTIAPLVTVRLNGAGSYDPQGFAIQTFRWSFVSKPVGSTTVIVLPSMERPTFIADVAGRYELQLEVRNRAGLWDPTPDTVVIEAIPDKRFYVQLTWNAASDQDLHVVRDGFGLFENPGDCAFCNRNPSWYASGGLDDPSLDIDDIDGYGPETTTIESPGPSALFHVKVHYYGVGGAASCGGSCPNSRATLDFYVDGILVHSMQRVMLEDDDLWHAATVDGATLTITPTDTTSTSTRTSCY